MSIAAKIMTVSDAISFVEEHYRDVLKSIPDLSAIAFDLDFSVVFTSGPLFPDVFTGLSEGDEKIDENVYLRKYCAQVLAGDSVFFDAHSLIGLFGYLGVSFPIRGADGAVKGGILLFFRSGFISSENMPLLRQAVDQSSNAIAITDDNGAVIYANATFSTMTGYTLGEILGKRLSLIKSGYHGEVFYREMWSTILRQKTWQGEMCNRKKDGSYYWVKSTITPVIGQDHALHFIAVQEDITESRRLSDLADKAQAQLLTLLKTLPSPLMVTSVSSGHVLYVNQSLIEEFGDSNKDWVGSSVVDLYYNASDRDRLIDLILENGVVNHYEVRLKGGGASEQWYSLWSKLITFNQQDAIITNFYNTTELHASRVDTEIALRRLREANSELEQFVYIISHDLREPVRMIRSYVDLLVSRYGNIIDDSAREFFGFIVSGAKRLQSQLDALLVYSRTGRLNSPELIDLNTVFSAVVRDLSLYIEERNAVVISESLPTIYADFNDMVTLFQNLIANGLKYNESGRPTVEVSAYRDDGAWKVVVRDNGVGIDPAHHERIFTVFSRLYADDEYSGAGIGLSLCEKIVKKNGGSIGVVSQLGSGSSFWFKIPDLIQNSADE